MDMEFAIISTEINMMVSGQMINLMERENISVPMVKYMMDNLKMI